jgi:hypothetical protein
MPLLVLYGVFLLWVVRSIVWWEGREQCLDEVMNKRIIFVNYIKFLKFQGFELRCEIKWIACELVCPCPGWIKGASHSSH